jgi:hypothetical protein
MKILALVSFLSILSLFAEDIAAQGRQYNRSANMARGSGEINQWWIGVRGGVNFSNGKPESSYSVFSFTQPVTNGDDEKKYHPYSLPGLQFGFSIGYEFIRGLSANIFPSYNSYRFSYDNSFRWYDSQDQGNRVLTKYNIETRLQHIVLPFTIKYELTTTRMKPYIQVGAYYSLLTDALKRVNITGIDEASGADTEINVTELSEGINDRIRNNNYGILGGAGFTYNVGNARIGLEINYHYGLANLDNPEMKYTDNSLITGTYDVPDDFTMDNVEMSMQLIIPLKFITSKDYIPL